MKLKILHILLASFFILAAVCSGPVFAQDNAGISAEEVAISNQIILDIYQDILAQKINFPGLDKFGEDNFFRNRRGIYAIVFKNDDPQVGPLYHFGITINAIDDVDFENVQGIFNYGFPKLNLKISGFQVKRTLRSQFDLTPLISKHGFRLAEYQQEFMPLRIFVEPESEVYGCHQPIVLKVTLKNVSKRHMIVQTLGAKTLYLMFNGETWGTSPGAAVNGRVGTMVLKSGKETTLVLRGASFDRPQKVDITCVYRMSIDGVNPMGKASVTIQE